MSRFLPALAAVFVAMTFSAYAEEKQSPPPAVEQTANPMDKSGQGDPQSSGTGGVKAGGETVDQPGRADPTPSQGAGGVTSPTPTGPGRGDNQ